MPPKKSKSDDPDYKQPKRSQVNPSTPAKTRNQDVSESQFFVEIPKVTVGALMQGESSRGDIDQTGQTAAFSGAFSGATAAFTEASAIARNIGETVRTVRRELSDLEEENLIPKMPWPEEGARGGQPGPPGPPVVPAAVPELDPQVKAYVS